MKHLYFFACCCLLSHLAFAQNISERVYEDPVGNLRYFTDTEQNRIPDFSHAGYMNGEAPIPTVPTRLTVSPIAGDNTANIQSAIDAVGAMMPDANGIRGAVLLTPGSYDVFGVLTIPYSGVVLRGSGQGEDPTSNTVIFGQGFVPAERELIVLGDAPGSTSWNRSRSNTRTDITSEYLPIGSRTLEIADVGPFAVGDNVIVVHPSTDEWLASIDFGGVADDEDGPWRRNELNILYNRHITAINAAESKVTLDAPIFDHLDRSLSQSELYTYDDANLVRKVGIENLRIDVEARDPLEFRDHVRSCILMEGVDNSWVTDVTGLNFSYALVDHVQSTRVSILRCSALEPQGPIAGGLRYNFAVNGQSNNILFSDCFGTEGRHTFVSNGASQAAGIVWTDSNSERDYAMSEGHRRWSQGLLFDNITFSNQNLTNTNNPLMALWNRGNFGTGHGWASVNSVGWRVRTPGGNKIAIQKPPGRQNYCIGCGDVVTGEGPFDHPTGFIEFTNETPAIESLYDAQLQQRLTSGVAPDGPARLTLEQAALANTLNWLDVASGEDGYAVEFSIDGGDTFVELAQLPANSTSYVHNDPPDTNRRIIYRVYATGALPSPYSNQAVEIDLEAEGAEYFDGTTTSISMGGSAAGASTFTLDEDCETFKIEITDPVNNPANPFGAYSIEFTDASDNAVIDFSGQLNVTFRVRSAATVELDVVFRSGGGSSPERTVRKQAIVSCGLSAWTDVTFEFEQGDFGVEFDPSNIRDVQFILDRGKANFAGNEFYIDHIVAGGPADTARHSPCDISGEGMTPSEAELFTGLEEDRLSRTEGAGPTSTFIRNEVCGWIELSVTNPGNPLALARPYHLLLGEDNDNAGINLGDCVRATMRVWSAETVEVLGKFASGEGSMMRTTERKAAVVEGGGTEWTELEFVFLPSDLGEADLTNASSFQFYLDFSSGDFPGNRFLIDDITIGSARDTTNNSPCDLADLDAEAIVIRENFQDEDDDRLNRGNLAAQATTFESIEDCEAIRISINDPVGAPLPRFNAYAVNIIPEGSDATSTDLSNRLKATIRIWSAETIELGALFRSGTGSQEERTSIVTQTVAGGGNEWTNVTFVFRGDDTNGLDSMDVIDFWFYLNRGEENFPGNNVLIDDITVGGSRDMSQSSPCSPEEINAAEPSVVRELFESAASSRISQTNSAGSVTTFDFDEECGYVRLSVTDTAAAPLPPFSPYSIDLSNEDNSNIDLSGRLTAVVRLWSAETVELAGLFRSGEGTGDERTMRQTQIVNGGGEDWTEVTFSFLGTDIGGLDSTDVTDFWFYLDRGTENFAGNDVIIDDITVGTDRDPMFNSDCPVGTVSVGPYFGRSPAYKLYPTLTTGQLRWTGPIGGAFRISDSNGRMVASGKLEESMDFSALRSGVYFLLTELGGYKFIRR